MDAVFGNLQKAGQNNVDGLVGWLKDAKVLDKEGAENKARELFAGADAANISLEKFKEVISQLASFTNLNVEDIMKRLGEGGGRILEALKSKGAAAVMGMLGK